MWIFYHWPIFESVSFLFPQALISILTNFCLFQPILTGNGHLLGQISLGQISEPLPKRPRIFPPTNERIMIYVKQETEDAFTALHVKPPTAQGLIGKGNY